VELMGDDDSGDGEERSGGTWMRLRLGIATSTSPSPAIAGIILLILGYSNAQGHTNPLRGCNREDPDLIIILILRGHSPIICSSC
jgi:hypothetical protein